MTCNNDSAYPVHGEADAHERLISVGCQTEEEVHSENGESHQASLKATHDSHHGEDDEINMRENSSFLRKEE